MLSSSLEKAGPKHSTSVAFSSKVAVPLSVDEYEVALVPNPVPVPTVKGLPSPHGPGALAVLCTREHSLLPFTLQMVIPFLSPVTVHLKVNLSPGQVGGAAVNCPATSPWRDQTLHTAYTVDMILSCSKVTKLLSHSSAFFLSVLPMQDLPTVDCAVCHDKLVGQECAACSGLLPDDELSH